MSESLPWQPVCSLGKRGIALKTDENHPGSNVSSGHPFPETMGQTSPFSGLVNTNRKSNTCLCFMISSFFFFQTRFSFKPRFYSHAIAMAAERIKLPGFGLPVNYRPEKHFPNAVLDWSGTVLTVRELNMMAIMDKITDKPDWDKKVFDDTIVQKWRLEALATEDKDVSEKMLDWVCTTFFETSYSIRYCDGEASW